jgi:hypothetical protein
MLAEIRAAAPGRADEPEIFLTVTGRGDDPDRAPATR